MKRSSTKGALYTSFIALVLCCTMLLGTTFAWFTDEVTSANNIIKSGTLDVEFYYSTDMSHWEKIKPETNVFKEDQNEADALWEPGYSKVVYLKVANLGDLSLKYQLGVNIAKETAGKNKAGEMFKLSDYIEYGVIANVTQKYASREEARADVDNPYKLNKGLTVNSEIKAGEAEKIYALVVYMPEEVGNVANHLMGAENKPHIELGLGVFATQLTSEADSFDDQYDYEADMFPAEVKPEDFGSNVAYVNGKFYATFKEAVDAVNAAAEAASISLFGVEEPEQVGTTGAVIYLKQGADLGTITHLDIITDLTVYGNGAFISGGERDLAIETAKQLEKDITINIYKLDGIGIWGDRKTENTVNVNLYNCKDLSRVFVTGTAGKNNFALYNCEVDGETLIGDTGVYSNANGSVIVDGCEFTKVECPVNLNHKVAGNQTVTVKDSTFTDCATEGTAAYYAPVRVYNSADGADQTIEIIGNSFEYSEGMAPINGADVLLNKIHNGVDAVGTVTASVQANATTVSGKNVDLTWTVTNADDLYAIAAYVNQFDDYQHYYDGEVIKLMNDIDLGGAEWTPIGDYRFSANRFCGTFDGQGHTISNFKITKKTDKNDDNKSAYGFFGNLSGIVKNLTLDKATIMPGAKFAGVLAGRFNGCTHTNSVSRIENCKVTNSEVLIKNWTVGGLVGQWNEGTISGCTVENTTVTGMAAVGAIAGVALNEEDHVAENCVVKNCTLVQNGSYGEGWDDMFAAIVGSVHSKGVRVTLNNCTVENTTVKGEKSSALYGYMEDGSIVTVNSSKLVASAGDINDSLANGESVILTGDVKTEAETTAPYGNKYAIKMDGGVLDGNGNELHMECYGDDYGIMTSGGTIKNITIKEGCRAVMIMNPTEDVILDNVNIGGDGVLYPINTGESGEAGIDLIVTNSTLAGWTSYGDVVASASFANVEFKQGTYYNNIYGRVLKPYVNTTITDCKFVAHMNLDLSALKSGHKITITNSTVNGQPITADTFTIPTVDDQYDTELFTIDLPSWASAVSDCVVIK